MYKTIDSCYEIHKGIMKRCYVESCKLYPWYGAKGITVCNEWHILDNFRKWSLNNGYKIGLRLLRYDTKGNYEPNNCFWGENPNKSYGNVYDESYKTLKQSVMEKCKELGIDDISVHPIAKSYNSMVRRCYKSSSSGYKYYGGRGIKICDEWRGVGGLYRFFIWSLEYGGWEDGLTIDRINPNKDYAPNNCKWATSKEQGIHKRNTRIFYVNGEEYSALSYCKKFDLPYDRFIYRLNKGMSINKILDELEK